MNLIPLRCIWFLIHGHYSALNKFNFLQHSPPSFEAAHSIMYLSFLPPTYLSFRASTRLLNELANTFTNCKCWLLLLPFFLDPWETNILCAWSMNLHRFRWCNAVHLEQSKQPYGQARRHCECRNLRFNSWICITIIVTNFDGFHGDHHNIMTYPSSAMMPFMRPW